MRIVFMGTPEFAVPPLTKLCESKHDIVAVYTRPDAKSRRGNKLQPSPVKVCANKFGLDVFTPKTLRDASEQKKLKALQPDIILVAAYGAILPREVLQIPRLGCVNIHASLLPRWRGAAPIQRAILAGDKQAGVCIMQMEEGLDTGRFCEAGRTDIGQKSMEELSDELAQIGADALACALPEIEAGTYKWKTQNENNATYAEKLTKEETMLDPAFSAAQLARRVQASSKRAPSRCVVCGKEITVVKACAFVNRTSFNGAQGQGDAQSSIGAQGKGDAVSSNGAQTLEQQLAAGEVYLDKKRIVLGTANGCLELCVVKPQGKAEMPAKNWIAGLRTQDLTWHSI